MKLKALEVAIVAAANSLEFYNEMIKQKENKMNTLLSSHRKVSTLEDLSTLDNELVIEGYRWGLSNSCISEVCSRAFWHGWRNAQIDTGRVPPDAESISLARETATNNSMANLFTLSGLTSTTDIIKGNQK